MNIDYAIGRKLYPMRILLVLAFCLLPFTPAALPWILFVSINYFKGYTHHNQMPFRILQFILVSFFAHASTNALLEGNAEEYSAHLFGGDLIILLTAIWASHYLVPGLAKIRIGGVRNNWIWSNRLHFLVASAFSSGWLNFLEKTRVIRIIRVVKTFEIPLQFATVLIECGVILLLFRSELAMALLVAIAVLHVSIFIFSGILFWQNILTAISFILLLASLSSSQANNLFSFSSLLSFHAILLILLLLYATPLAVIKPSKLAWWDTPFAGRVQWIIKGASGKLYGLYNNLLKPHERLFGRIYGHNIIDQPLLYYHLGEVFSFDLRNQIVGTRGDKGELMNLTIQSGSNHSDAKKRKDHDRLLQLYAQFIDQGKDPGILPHKLSFLSPPGGQYYYWGNFPRFNHEEKVEEVQVRLIENFFDGSDFIEIRNESIKTIKVNKPG